MNRKLVWLVTVLVLASLHLAEAQQPAKTPRMGLLTWAGPSVPSSPTPFDQGLRQLGYVEGQNIVIERRYANGQMDRLPGFAVDLARLPLDVILTQSFPAALAAKQATSAIPIVRLPTSRIGLQPVFSQNRRAKPVAQRT